MHTLRTYIRKYAHFIFAAAGTILVLWQMLLPGYILTWDMVFGPSRAFPALAGFLNGAPLTLLIYAAGLIIPMWLVQKAILVALFFCLFYLPLRFFPFKVSAWATYAGATLYAINPFVYERFLAGHWKILFAYALLAPFVYFLLAALKRPSRRSAIFLGITVLLVGLFSLHVLVMTILIAAAALLFVMLRERSVEALKTVAITGVIVLLGSLYWLIPFALRPGTAPIENFSRVHWEAFATSADPLLGLYGNVLSLNGFWGESYPWMQTLLSPKDTLLFSLTLPLVAVVLLGVRALLRSEDRFAAFALIAIASISFIFSLGIAPSIFQNFNLWLFEHVPIWRGFRDTEKWSMWLALTYAYLFAAGAAYLTSRIRPSLARAGSFTLVMLPLLCTPAMLGGFSGQLKSVEYPAMWYEAKAILAADPACKAIFLPWHQYYRLAFNDGMLTANPAPRFFDCAIVSSQDAEIGEVGDQGIADPLYHSIAAGVENNDPQSIDSTILSLREAGITYIIATNDVEKYDVFSYPFLGSAALVRLYNGVVDNQALAIFKL